MSHCYSNEAQYEESSQEGRGARWGLDQVGEQPSYDTTWVSLTAKHPSCPNIVFYSNQWLYTLATTTSVTAENFSN